MPKNNNYGNYILSDKSVNYKLNGYNNRDLTKYKHEIISNNKIVVHFLDIHVERLNPDPYIRRLPFYKIICDICSGLFWRKKSYDNYKKNMCGYKCQGKAMSDKFKIRSFESPGINSWGYPCFRIERKQITCHRWAMELHLGRELKTDELVHHIDMDKMNYDISNLHLCTRDSHIVIHGTYNECCKSLMKNPGQIAFNRKIGRYYLINQQ